MPSKTHFKFHPSFYWLIHPSALALYVFLILYFSLPDYFKKYEVEVVSSKPGLSAHYLYDDLNNNGKEELALTAIDSWNTPKLLVNDHKGSTINQWNFKGNWLGDRENLIDDFNHNQLKEVYCLTYEKDSIFLNIIEPFNKNDYVCKNRFIDKLGFYGNKKHSIEFVSHKLIDTNNDGFKEYVFVLYAGFSKFPRKVYVYDIKNDSLLSSPESAAGISIRSYFSDINNDGVDEVCGKVTAHENIHYPMPYTDSSSWLMVFNLKDSVDFLFPPIEHNTGIGSQITTYPYYFQNESYLVTIFINRSAKQNTDSLEIRLYTPNGKLIKTKSYNKKKFHHLVFFPTPNKPDNLLYFYDWKGNIYKTDTSLNLRKHYQLKDPGNLKVSMYREYNVPINKVSDEVYLLFATKIDQGTIFYSSDLKHHVFLNIPSLNGSSDWKISSRTPTLDDPSNLVINGSTRVVKILYKKNWLYNWKYPIYGIVYFLLFLIFWLLQKGQKSFLAKTYETEKQLMQHQMALSKKQMEPHFMLNMINNIGYMFSKEDKQDAMYYLGKLGSIMRRGLINSSASQISLEEELEFVEDYLILQKKLMDDTLEYSIQIDKNIEEELIQIPHSILYTFVENAIKHGLKPKEFGRKLDIRVEQAKKQIKITIQDNGIGRQKSKELDTTDTGKGMEIIKTIIKGYNQLHGGEIRYEVEDVLGEMGESKGTLVYIWI